MGKGVIVLAAGGTGGHLFPAEALAHELKARGWDVHLATDARAQRFAGAFAEDHVHVIRSATIAGRNPLALMKTFWSLWQGNLDSRKLFRRLKPKLVAGFGGYPTLPPLYAASNMQIPTMVHEQNAVMGRANKGLAGRVKAIAGGFLPETGGAYAEKTVTTGNPVRPPVLAAAGTPYKPVKADERFRLLVLAAVRARSSFNSHSRCRGLAVRERPGAAADYPAGAQGRRSRRAGSLQEAGYSCRCRAVFQRYAGTHGGCPVRDFALRRFDRFRDHGDWPSGNAGAVSACARS